MNSKTKSVVKGAKPSKKLTQAEIAEESGVSQQSISKRLKKADGITAKLNAAKLRRWTAAAISEEMDVEKKRGTLVEFGVAMQVLEQNVSRARAMLDAAFRSELPARQGGLPADKIAEMNGERLDEIYLELSKPLK